MVVGTWLRLQMICHDLQLLISSNTRTFHQIKKLNILAEEDVKVLRSDNYTSNDFFEFCSEKGISHLFTVPYSPQQKGVVERMNSTITEGARSMLYQANLPLEFWATACSTAVYLHNRSPTAALKNETPFECLFGRKPNISNLRVFGCVSYVHISDKQCIKLDAKPTKQFLSDVLLVSRDTNCMIWKRRILL